MRANMKDKPLDFPREYFEVHCTTAEKKYFEYMAYKYDHANISDYIMASAAPRPIPNGIYIEDALPTGLTEEQKIERWIKKLAGVKAHNAIGHNTNTKDKPKAKATKIKTVVKKKTRGR